MKGVDTVLERTVAGLGYELVDFELSNHGRMLRVFIDKAGFIPAAGRTDGVTVEDCERVTRQLQRVLPVEGIEYDRLEVSSPGLDRVLKKPADFRRFTGFEAELRLRVPLNGRRRFTGVMRSVSDEGVDLDVEGVLFSFAFADLDKARLVPKL